jgi:octaprenyl-diphosphate synthase
MTLPLIRTLRCCTAAERERVAAVVEDDLSEEGLSYVIGIIERYDGIGHTRRRARVLVERAKQRLTLFEDGPEKQALCELADYVVNRRK